MKMSPVTSRLPGLILGFLLSGVALLGMALGCGTQTEGAKLWRHHCAECHGLEGRGNLLGYSRYPLVNLVDDAWSGSSDTGSLEEIVLQGVFPVMPAFDQLDDDELRAIMDHLQMLRGEIY